MMPVTFPFDTTLPRFDLMAQLERAPDGLKMGELSKRMMVTGGNVTGITDQLVSEGLVVREDNPRDRRAYIVRLTPKGVQQFSAIAKAHEGWIDELLVEIDAAEAESIIKQLDGLVRRVRSGEARV